MINYVNMKTNTCIFGYGGIDTCVIGQKILFKGIKPPQGAGTTIWTDDGEKVGDWEHDGNQISVIFCTLNEIEFVCDQLKDIEENLGGSFKFKDVTFDFTTYKQASMDVVKMAMRDLRANIVLLMAC